MRARGANAVYLPDIRFPSNLSVTDDLSAALAGTELIVSAVPSHGTREILKRAAPYVHRGSTIVSATKGLEQDTLLRVSEIIGQELRDVVNVAVLSGPSFAAEVAAGQPTAVVAACHDLASASRVQHALSSDVFRVYTHDDVVGVELGGALKNVMAVATGIAEGLGLGFNSQAALITRGLAEMTRLGVALGASQATFAGLAGLGDLVLTCTGALSRNRALGIEMGKGTTLDQALEGKDTVAEGVLNTISARALAEREGVDMPIVLAVHRILFEAQPARLAISELMTRELRAEQD